MKVRIIVSIAWFCVRECVCMENAVYSAEWPLLLQCLASSLNFIIQSNPEMDQGRSN